MFLKLHSLSVAPRNTSLLRRSHTYLYTFARFSGADSFSGALSVRPLRSWGGGHEIPADDRKGLTSRCESTLRRNRPNKLSIFAASSATFVPAVSSATIFVAIIIATFFAPTVS